MDWLLILLLLTLLTLLKLLDQVDHSKKDRWIVISPMWGLCNRLRTLRVGHDLAKALNRHLAVIDNTNDQEFTSMFNGRLRDLFSNQHVRFIDAVPTDGTVSEFTYNSPNNDCTFVTTLAEMTKIESDYIVIKACGLSVYGLVESDEFYKSIIPTPIAANRMMAALNQISPTTVGVHIRQGNISDYRKGNFFGAWKKDQDPNKLPIQCCTSANSADQVCPDNAPHIEKFIDAIRTLHGSPTVFICSDRPGCYQVLTTAFPGRVISNPVEIEYDANALNAFCDWYCLAKCSQIIVTSISSFSTEAAKMNNAKVISIS